VEKEDASVQPSLGSDHRPSCGSFGEAGDAWKGPGRTLNHYGSRSRGIHSRDILGSAHWLVSRGTNGGFYNVDFWCDRIAASLSGGSKHAR
jgi:hypothetical protein